jgi:septum formation protein
MGLPFIVRAAEIDETFPPGRADFDALCGELAARKIAAVLDEPDMRGYRWFLGADTVVLMDGKVFGKPKDEAEARRLLSRLAGRGHDALTGIALYDRKAGRFTLGAEKAAVRFAPMTEAEIAWYASTGEWRGVAGGYRIQGLGGRFIESLEGNYNTVMGLPIRAIYVMLRDNSYPVERTLCEDEIFREA